MPTEVTRFLRGHIRSVEQLEVLLLLAGDPARSWTPGELAGELRTAEMSVAQRLALLDASGLARPDDAGWRFTGDTSEVEGVARCYRSYRVAVIEEIFAVDEDAAPDAVSSFAEAFRLRREQP